MAQSNSKKPFDAFKFAVQVRLATAVKLRVGDVPKGLESLVNTEIDKMFNVLSNENGGRFIGNAKQLSDWRVQWLPLGKSYEQSKSKYTMQGKNSKRTLTRIPRGEKANPSTFYNNMGDLIREMRAGQFAGHPSQPMSKVLGGLTTVGYDINNKERYKYQNVQKEVIRDIKSGKIQNTSINQTVTLDMLGRLKKMNMPEMIFGFENSIKLGLVNGHFTEWHRPFIREYALWYARTVISEKVKQAILKRKK